MYKEAAEKAAAKKSVSTNEAPSNQLVSPLKDYKDNLWRTLSSKPDYAIAVSVISFHHKSKDKGPYTLTVLNM